MLAGLLLAVYLAIGLVVVAYMWWPGGGLGAYTDANNVTHRAKTAWDWADLCIVPLALGLIALGFTYVTERARRRTEERRAMEADLNDYFDRMRELLKEGLSDSERRHWSRGLAKAHTMAILPRLDGPNKGRVVQFLAGAGLLTHYHPESPPFDITGADLRSASLARAYLEGAVLSRVDLTDANLEGAILRGARLEGASLTRANLRMAMLAWTKLTDADLTGADLRGAIMAGTPIEGVVTDHTTLMDPQWRLAFEILLHPKEGRSLAGADLEGAYLVGACLRHADLVGSCLRLARLQQADLAGADLSGANLEGADLVNASLVRADLTGANLRNAHLEDTDLTDSDLTRADLKGARHTSATLALHSPADFWDMSAQLAKAASLAGTILPDGTVHE